MLPRLGDDRWAVCCVLGVQERSVAVLELFRSLADRVIALRLVERAGSPWAELRSEAVRRNHARLERLCEGCAELEIVDYDLGARDEDQIRSIKEWIGAAGNSAALDITGLPERALFWSVRTALRSAEGSLLLTYCGASDYTHSVMVDVREPRSVAMFHGGPDLSNQVNVVSVGFNNPGLAAAVDLERGSPQWRIIMPQPSSAGWFRRNWQAIEAANLPEVSPDNFLVVKPMDISLQVRLLRSIRDGPGSPPLVMLPYGPKPTTAAMAIVACETEGSRVRVIASDPLHYNPHYSLGVGRDRAGLVSYGHLIRIRGLSFL